MQRKSYISFKIVLRILIRLDYPVTDKQHGIGILGVSTQ